MDKNKEISFLPYHALNEFMTTEYRLEVIQTTLEALPNLPERYSKPINQLTKKIVKVPGFRNSLKAPTAMKVKPTFDAFEKRPDLVAAIISAWSEIHSDLRLQVSDLLKQREWDLLPAETDRTKLPGFLTIWPQGETFEVLNQAFNEVYPGVDTTSNDVSLMAVWISGRLPYQFSVENEEDEDQEDGTSERDTFS